MTLIIFWRILFFHWLADFVFQTDGMAKGKADNSNWLWAHVWTYGAVIGIGMWNLKWAVFNVGAHFVIDYFTSKVNKRLWADGKIHWFFVSIGFDQLLHFICLTGSWVILS